MLRPTDKTDIKIGEEVRVIHEGAGATVGGKVVSFSRLGSHLFLSTDNMSGECWVSRFEKVYDPKALKVGDRVVLKTLDYGDGRLLWRNLQNTVGNTGTINQIKDWGNPYIVDWDNGTRDTYADNHLELLVEDETLPFGEMDKEQKRELMHSWIDGETVQMFCTITEKWSDVTEPTWSFDVAYRIKPAPTAEELEIQELEGKVVELKAQIDEFETRKTELLAA